VAEANILAAVVRHFGQYQRPEDFIDRGHCCECDEHYNELLGVPVDALTHEHTGDGAWDPTAFLTPDAFKYYFAGLARIADGDRHAWLDQFLMRFAVHFTDSFSPEDWAITEQLLEYWWLDESLSEFQRDGLERALDVCRRGRAGAAAGA
jgi:hypothetical protein